MVQYNLRILDYITDVALEKTDRVDLKKENTLTKTLNPRSTPDASKCSCPNFLLANLSWRLIGELISIRPSILNFKHLLPPNHLANQSQIFYRGSSGKFVCTIWVTWPKWLPCSYITPSKIFFSRISGPIDECLGARLFIIDNFKWLFSETTRPF